MSAIMDTLAMTQSITDGVSHIIKRYSNSSDVVVRQYHSYIILLGKQHCHPPTSESTSNLRLPTADLGSMSALPTEIIQEICLRLNLRSLAKLKTVNRQMSSVVDAMPQYHTIIGHSPSLLKGLLSVEIGDRVTCHTLYEKLKNEACETCGGYGSHFYLLKCKRVCYMCFMFH